VTVDYATADDTASAPSDYTTVPTTMLTFLPGETSRQVNVSVNGDSTFEADENFFVNLANGTNATISDGQGVGTIQNDDGQPTISIDDQSHVEGNSDSSNFDFAVMLSNPSDQTITVHYSTADNTATRVDDYSDSSGTLTFMPGDTLETLSVSVNGDTTFEGDESFTVNLDTPANATILDGAGLGTIQNDDSQPAVRFALASSSGDESVSPVNLTVSLSNDSVKMVTVNYAVNGSSTATGGGVDYTLIFGTLTIDPGQTSKNLSFTTNDDNLDENDETVVVDLSTPTNATLGSSTTHTYTVKDDDAATVFTISDVILVEGNSSTTDFIFTVTRTGPTALTSTVDYATVDGATEAATGGLACSAGIDYEAKIGSLTFAPADTTMMITIPVCGDALNEAPETFFVNLSNANHATIGDNQGLGTITNDDSTTYNFEGFFTPVVNAPIINTVKAGSAVPVKWRLTNAGGAPVSDPNSFLGIFSYQVNCGSTDSLEAPVETVAPGGSGLQYLGDGNWQINWKTLTTYPRGSCRVMELRLNDGTSNYANFKFK
jgi:hypothetical protein